MEKLKVIYISGAGRSGSTVFGRVLGAFPGALALNEIHQFPVAIAKGFRHCSCGEEVAKCIFWKDVLSLLKERGIDPKEYSRLWDRIDRLRWAPRLFFGLYGQEMGREIERYKIFILEVFSAIQQVSQAEVLVDASKNPGRALLLSAIAGIDLEVIHLVRDPRAVVHSWARQKNTMHGKNHRQRNPVWTAANWVAVNWFTERLRQERVKVHRVNYEGFAESPLATLQAVREESLHFRGRELPAFQDRSIVLAPNHSVSGNMNRFESGAIRIRPDKDWHDKLSVRVASAVKFVTLPMLRKYGYA